LRWEIITLIFLVYVVAWILLKFSYKIPLVIGIFLLIASPLSLLVTETENTASQIGIYAFYFLISGVVIAVINYLRKSA